MEQDEKQQHDNMAGLYFLGCAVVKELLALRDHQLWRWKVKEVGTARSLN